MFATNYYTLVAGFREYALDADHKGFDALEIRNEVLETISARDSKAVELLYGYYDCENIIAARAGRSAHNALGNLTREEIEAELSRPSRLPAKLQEVICAFLDPEGEEAETIDTTKPFEKALLAAYYALCEASACRFLKEWARFDRNLRNVSAAITARELNRPIEEVTVGEGEIVEQLQRSSASDFGLRGELQYLDAAIAAISDEQNIVEKEHKIDLIRWNECSELSAFDYFDINAVVAYLVKVNLVARWSMLDVERGREMFRKLLAELDGKDMINKQ
ncbi:MAG: DUF2764 family protein [Rikenellaceae bacterium]|nr:DUF2764 family protein [Rikenellaceae bacterium]